MDYPIEAKISTLIEHQFPAFYQTDGPMFIQFVKAYYEWLEEEGKAIHRARRVTQYTDIDDTLEEFLVYFQKKFLYGIPFDVIINKRFLLKHVLDVYRSKGSVQCYKLLFRLIYNQDTDVYLPGRDMLRASDGRWKDIRYIEVSNVADLEKLVGKTIVGLSSGTTAVVESCTTQPINNKIVAVLYISNIFPKNGQMNVGEKVIDKANQYSANLVSIVGSAPTILGSLDKISIINGGREFVVGDVLKLVSRNLTTNQLISAGIDGLVRVSNTFGGRGSIQFNVQHAGSGLMANADVFTYNGPTDVSGNGANFGVGSLITTEYITFNTDVLCDYMDLTINAVSYGFPSNGTANGLNTLTDTLEYANGLFGSIGSLSDLSTGRNYNEPLRNFVRSVLRSKTLAGTLSYNTGSNTVTGTSTLFQRYLANGDVVFLQANSANASTGQLRVIQTVVSNTNLLLYGPPTINSTASALYKIAPSVLVSNYPPTSPVMFMVDGSIKGLNANVTGIPSFGNSVIETTHAINSGRGYIQGETIEMYLYGGLTAPVVANGGVGYANGEPLVFSGGSANKPAQAIVVTNSNGTVASVTTTYFGSGYTSEPIITVRTANGSGAVFTTDVTEFNTLYTVTGTLDKIGIGRRTGFYTSSDGFLNADKYLQDSYFYQDFSYQIKAASVLDRYSQILYDTFHIAGTELFGQYHLINDQTSTMNALSFSSTRQINEQSDSIISTGFHAVNQTIVAAADVSDPVASLTSTEGSDTIGSTGTVV